MPYKDKSKQKEYRHQYYLNHRILHGYHANNGSFKKGFKFADGIREKMALARKGIPLSSETKLKLSLAHKGWNPSKETREKMRLNNLGKKLSLETIEKIRKTNKGQKRNIWPWKGENHWAWIADRTTVVKRDHNSTKEFVYTEWRTNVFIRDNFKCRIADENCKGQLEAHHILGWKSYPELRYNINNGITLCHAHHPRGRAKEELLAPVLQALIAKT